MSTKNENSSNHVFLWGDLIDSELIVDLIGFLQQSRRTAVLTVSRDNMRKSLYAQEGLIHAASSNLPEDRLGNIMLRNRMLTHEELAAALLEVGAGKKIGNVLIEKGMLDALGLHKLIEQQIQEILYSMVLLDEGEYTLATYNIDAIPTHAGLPIQPNLLDGLRRKDEMQHALARLPKKTSQLRRLVDTKPADLDPVESSLFELIDGQRTMEELFEVCPHGYFNATMAIQRLLKAGVVG